MNPKLNQNAKPETQTPPKLGTTAFPQAFATYLIFVQRNIFLGSLLCKYLLSKTRTCLLSCKRNLQNPRGRTSPMLRTHKVRTSTHKWNGSWHLCSSSMLNTLKSPLILIKSRALHQQSGGKDINDQLLDTQKFEITFKDMREYF